MKLLTLILIMFSFLSYGQMGDSCLDSVQVRSMFCISCSDQPDYSLELDCEPDKFIFTIYDNEKHMVFQTVDPNFHWNGRLPNEVLIKPGTYVWHLDIQKGYRVFSDKGFLNVI